MKMTNRRQLAATPTAASAQRNATANTKSRLKTLAGIVLQIVWHWTMNYSTLATASDAELHRNMCARKKR